MTQLVIVLLILVVFLLSRDECVMNMVKDTIKRFTRRKTKVLVKTLPSGVEIEQDSKTPPVEVTDNADEAPAEALPLGEALSGTNPGDIGTDSFMNSRELGGGSDQNNYDNELKLIDDKKEYVNNIKENIDDEIVESHFNYTKDSEFAATTGSSHASSRDDFNPPVGWHGLPRRAHFAGVGADNNARVFQSETADDINHYRNHHSTDYCL